jgi:hypothetical protein
LKHHFAESGFAGALLPALEHNNHASAFVGVLHCPCKPANEIPELLLVAPTNYFPDMPQKRPYMPPRPARRDTEALPDVELVWFYCADRFEDDLTLMSLRAFFPEFFGRDALVVTGDEDISKVELKLFGRGKR